MGCLKLRKPERNVRIIMNDYSRIKRCWFYNSIEMIGAPVKHKRF